jgi:hypothetical protein
MSMIRITRGMILVSVAGVGGGADDPAFSRAERRRVDG